MGLWDAMGKIGPYAIAGGTTLLSGLLNKPKKPQPSPYETTLGQQAGEMYGLTFPLMQKLTGDYGQFLQGDYDIGTHPRYRLGKRGIEEQYERARENILATAPRGGTQMKLLEELEEARAGDISTLEDQIAEDMMQKIYGTAFGVPQQSMAGLSTAAGTYGPRLGAMESARRESQAATGRTLGYLMAQMLFK